MRKQASWLMASVLALSVLAACGSESSTADTAAPETEAPATEAPDTTAAGGDTTAPAASGEACPGTVGCVPAGQPDVNGDGTVTVGVLSPGDTNDNGYYESFVTTANQYADTEGWTVTISDRVKPEDAVVAARNLCLQGADMVAIGDSILKDALAPAQEEVCAKTVFFISSSEGVEVDGFVFVTQDDINESQVTAGYATGLVLQQAGGNKVGFISGPDLDFVTTAYNAWLGGIKQVVADATGVKTLTGDFDDSAKGQEAAAAQLSQGVQLIYPYLGGATDAVVKAADEKGVGAVAPGTDRCATPGYVVSSLFSPGDFFAAALERFKAGDIAMGVPLEFRVGVDSVPAAKVCESVPNAADLQAQVDEFMKGIADGTVDPDAIAAQGAA